MNMFIVLVPMLGVIALDEGLTEDERLPAVLRDRLAFPVDLTGIPVGAATGAICTAAEVAAARDRLAGVRIDDERLGVLCATGPACGVGSLRITLLAVWAARALAAHVAGALGMMANWDLRPLERELPRLAPRLVLVVGERDGTIPPRESWRVRALLPSARLVSLPGLGHLAHEEQPRRIAALILCEARKKLLPLANHDQTLADLGRAC